ncbi:MAG: sodium:proton antiporter [Prevotella sp.]|nr:sodium:proton antiporter [Prevotella sp.]MCF0192683.1 sodium:proton antiporter [Prevotella sp.]MCF0208622.1 sodium:proton antiporter [Bacteroidaceae bacterium]
MNTIKHNMHPAVGLIPIVSLVLFIAAAFYAFDGEIYGGGSQLAMLFATAVSLCISIGFYRYKWADYIKTLSKVVGETTESIAIIFLIGMLSASWMLCGAVPTLICYGVKVLSPVIFLFTTCLICSVISLMTGSSWSCIATIGVALYGIGTALGVPAGWTAGAIISGAYFGDKMSPLSETTVLAASTTGTPLFTHVRYMLGTTTPSMIIASIVFIIAGFGLADSDSISKFEQVKLLKENFNISLWTLLVPVITLIMIVKKVPALVTLFLSSILAGITAIILQPHITAQLAGSDTVNLHTLLKGITTAFVSGTNFNFGNAMLERLTSTGGMAGMCNTVWLIICALFYGASMIYCGMLQSTMSALTSVIKGRLGLVSSTVAAGITFNLTTCDQCTAIIITGSLYKDTYEREGFESKLLSRTIEDSTTIVSPLIPWSTCGMTQSAVLGIATLDYLPYCVFNYISPFMSILVAALTKSRPNSD